jgi:hypothetical protein
MDKIEKTISVIDRVISDGVIENYALGDATAVIFYTEPIATEDIDVFVHIRRAGQSVLMEFQPLFDYLRENGYEIKGEHAYIEDFPVQFLPVLKDLINEAVIEANEFELSGGVIVRVMSPEYLVAIMLDTGRLKDFLRINVFLEHDAVKREDLQTILEKHNLTEKWRQNIGQFQL